jgi:hypothetical protein
MKKTILAVLVMGALSCGLFSQQAQAAHINGTISFIGAVDFDHPVGTATTVNQFYSAISHIAGFSTVFNTTGDFSAITPGTLATMSVPWQFNPSMATPGLWSVGGFSFDLMSATVVTQLPNFINISATGVIHGAGFEDTAGTFTFTVTDNRRFNVGFVAVGRAVPDGGTTVMLLGLGISALGMARRFLKS